MAESNDLGRLLTQLRGVTSPVERLKLIARGWRSVRRLGPRERLALARQVGIDGAEDLIEGIAVGRGGLSPAAVQRALEAIKGADPARLKETWKDLHDPERRKVLIDRGLTTATDLLAGPGKPAEPDEPEPRRSPDAIEIAEEEDEEPAPPAATEPPAAQREVASPPRPPRPMSIAPAAAAVAAAAPKPSAPARKAEAPARARPIASAKAAPQAAEAPAPAAAGPPAVPPAAPRPAVTEAATPPRTVAPPAAAPRPSAVARLVRIIEGQGTLFRRLRALRENLDLARELGPEQLRAVLDCFAPGWARRRVLDAMLERRIPDSLHEAVFLIEQLDSAADRRWCAGTLLRDWDLAESDRDLVSGRYAPRRGAAAQG